MKKSILFNFLVDKENNQINVERSFDAPLDLVWAAWTEAGILDQWWAPKPFTNHTKSLDFKEGGRWHYFMESPEGERHFCLFDYDKIQPGESYSGSDAFCDENQKILTNMPSTHWHNSFAPKEDQTIVNCQLTFKTFDDLEGIIKMGFKEGFTMGMENLDQYINAQFYLRKEKKNSNRSRVSSYVNFPGNTEEALNFYKSVFKTEFIQGIQRFGDIPQSADHPPVDEAVKRMVLHVELPLLGDHILMATDSPKEMGFTVTPGNNMHLNLEPDSKEEADRIFRELSAGGEVTMPIQDMFWGAYYGSFTDKFGINWMVNYNPA